MAPGADPTGGDANCGIVRHFERFELDGIADRASTAASTTATSAPTAALDGRVEFPARPHAALGGPGTSWTAFNVLRSGTWSAQVFTDPTSTQPMELPGWYVWDTVELADGSAGLLASRGRRRAASFPTWELDVLRWNGSTFASVQHVAGVVPVLLPLRVDADPPHVRGQPLRRVRRPGGARTPARRRPRGPAPIREPRRG